LLDRIDKIKDSEVSYAKFSNFRVKTT